MHFKRHIELERGIKPIDILPFINVLFLLLIFFMFSSQLVTQSGIKVKLPRAVTSEVVGQENIEIILSGAGIIYFNGKVIPIAGLNTLLKQVASRNPSVLIKADKDVSLGRIVEIWDMCRNLGVSQVNIATNQ